MEKDIFQRLNITNKHDFNKILDFVFDSVGSYVSPRSISDTLRSNGTVIDKQTVKKYLDAMCDAYLIYKVPRFEIKGKGLLQTLNKYYVVDPCFAKVRLKKAVLKSKNENILIGSCINPTDIKKIKMPEEITSLEMILIFCSSEELERRLKKRDKERNCSCYYKCREVICTN